MSDTVPKSRKRDGKIMHFSVGAIVTNPQGEILLVDRKLPPPGFAGVAGHIDEGDTPVEAIIREVREESGLTIFNPDLLLEEFVPWNYCAAGVTGHHWYVFQATADGEPVPQPEEVKSVGWYSPNLLSSLKLEEVWRYWFQKLGHLDQ